MLKENKKNFSGERNLLTFTKMDIKKAIILAAVRYPYLTAKSKNQLNRL